LPNGEKEIYIKFATKKSKEKTKVVKADDEGNVEFNESLLLSVGKKDKQELKVRYFLLVAMATIR
jgi:hypothetical protein